MILQNQATQFVEDLPDDIGYPVIAKNDGTDGYDSELGNLFDANEDEEIILGGDSDNKQKVDDIISDSQYSSKLSSSEPPSDDEHPLSNFDNDSSEDHKES